MKKFLPILAAFALTPCAFAAAQPEIKFDFVEKIEKAPTADEARQAALAFEKDNKETFRKIHLGATLYMFLPHWEEQRSLEVRHGFCVLGENQRPRDYPAWGHFKSDISWYALPKSSLAPEIEKLKFLESAGYLTLEEGTFSVVCPSNARRKSGDNDTEFYHPKEEVRNHAANVPAYRYRLTEKALQTFFENQPMWHVVNDPKEGIENKPIMQRLHVLFPVGKIAIDKIENVERTEKENDDGNTIYTFDYTVTVTDTPQDLAKLLEIESPYTINERSLFGGYGDVLGKTTFMIDALPNARLKDYPNTPLAYDEFEEWYPKAQCRAAQNKDGQWIVKKCEPKKE